MVYFSLNNIRESIEVLRLNKAVIRKLAEDKSASFSGMVVLVVPALLNLVFASLLFPSKFGAIFQHFLFWSMLIPFITLIAVSFVVPVVAAKVFYVKADYRAFFRVISHAGIILWLSFIPFLVDFLGLFAAESFYNLIWFCGLAWILVVAYNFFVDNFRLNHQNSLILLSIFILLYFFFQYVLGKFLVGSYYGIFY